MVGSLHRALIVRNHDKLRPLLQLADQRSEGSQTKFVQRRVDFVHDTEGTWIKQEKRKNQRHRGERFFATREQSNLFNFFAGWLHHNRDARFEHVVGGDQFQMGLAAAQAVSGIAPKNSARRPRRFRRIVREPRD